MGKKQLDTILDGRPGRAESLIEVLQDLQAARGYLPEEDLRRISDRLAVPLIEVFRVANFYKAFSLTPRGRHLFTVCQGTACHVRGSPRLVDEVRGQLGVEPGETTADGEFTLETVNCLGCCALGPVAVLDGVYHEHLTPAKLRRLLARTRKAAKKKV